MLQSILVYHGGPVDESGDGPFAFTVRCLACTPDLEAHRDDCVKLVGLGVMQKGGGVDIITGDRVKHYPDMPAAYGDYQYLPDQEVDFVWGPFNPEAGLSFY